MASGQGSSNRVRLRECENSDTKVNTENRSEVQGAKQSENLFNEKTGKDHKPRMIQNLESSDHGFHFIICKSVGLISHEFSYILPKDVLKSQDFDQHLKM